MTEKQIAEIVQFLERMEPEVHKNAVEKGFWKESDPATKFALIGSEIGEFVDAMRKPWPCTKPGLEHLSNIEEELADIVIRCLDWHGYVRKEESESGAHVLNYRSMAYWNYASSNPTMDVVCYMLKAAGSHMASRVIVMAFSIASKLKIDLPSSIEAKHKYNLTRPHLHGKRF